MLHQLHTKPISHKPFYSAASFAVAAVSLLSFGVLPASAASNLITNGGFETGVIDPATTDLTLGGVQTTESTYVIGNSTSVHPSWVEYGPHAGSNNMMIVNSATEADKTVWSQSVAVAPGHVYQWEAYVRSSYAENPAQLSFTINGTQVAAQTVSNTGEWTKVSAPWTADTTTANLRIVDMLHVANGDDFAIDDISLTEIGLTVGKATGGIKFMVGDVSVQLDFVAMSDIKNGAKGNVNYKATNGNWFMGKVTGYYQKDNQAYFVGEITKSNQSGWKYFYVAVEDNGEGANAASPDEGVRVKTDSSPFSPTSSLAIGSWDIYTGNVQIHKF